MEDCESCGCKTPDHALMQRINPSCFNERVEVLSREAYVAPNLDGRKITLYR